MVESRRESIVPLDIPPRREDPYILQTSCRIGITCLKDGTMLHDMIGSKVFYQSYIIRAREIIHD